MTGGSSPEERQRAVDDFQNQDDVRVFLATIIAGGVGINHLSAGKFSQISIPLAPDLEQFEIANEIERRLSILKKADESVRLMICLEMIGYFTDEKNSQTRVGQFMATKLNDGCSESLGRKPRQRPGALLEGRSEIMLSTESPRPLQKWTWPA